VPADQVQGSVEDAVAYVRRWLEAELFEQVPLAAEQPVQRGAGDAGGGGQLAHGHPGQAVLALASAGSVSLAGVGGRGESRQDLLLGDSWRRHEIILDEMYRPVQYLIMPEMPSSSQANSRWPG
jgi:hypothetical protein